MSLRIAASIAARELRGGLAGFRILLICLALGVAAIAALGTVRAGITTGLSQQGASLLGGDAQAELTYRFARSDERIWLDQIATSVSETVDFRSMLVVERDQVERGLTQVKAVDDLYPLIGQVTLDPAIPLATALAGDGIVVERVLADRLGLAVGDTVRLGTAQFTLTAILVRYPDNAAAGFGLGPRSIVRTDALSGSGLLTEGTLFSTQYRLTLPEDTDLAQLESQAETKWRDSGMRWSDSRNGAGGTARFIDRIGAFLILMGLAGLAIGGVGVSAAVRGYLNSKTKVIATLRTLGASRRVIFLTYFLQIGAISALAILIGLVVGGGIPLALGPWIDAQLPIPSDIRISTPALIEAAIYGIFTALIFTLLPLARADQIRPADLFRGSTQSVSRPSWRMLSALAVLIGGLIATAVWFSGTLWLTLWTTGGIGLALFALWLAALGLRWLTGRVSYLARNRPVARLALSSISARNGETPAVVLSIGLGLSVLAAVGQIDGNLRASFADELPEIAPSYFFIDIQPDQIDGFNARLETDDGVSKVDTAPMLRGIITHINDQPAEDVAGPHWVLRGDRGVSYASTPPEGTTLTQGAWWPDAYSGPPQVSFAAEEAAELSLNIGDAITINILGRSIDTTISSFRDVSWEGAGIGFVMIMNEAALAGAPHSWIATVYADEASEAPILRDLANAYPNITAIRVRDAIDQVIELVSGISAATRYAAIATLLTGFFVLIGAAGTGEPQRRFEAAVLKTLGATRARILASFAFRSALLGLGAGTVAMATGIIGGWAVTTFIMDGNYQVIWSNALGVVGAGILVSLLAGLLYARGPLAARPAYTLRSQD